MSIQPKTALMIARGYRTTSTKALLVLARTPPILLSARGEAKAVIDKYRKKLIKKQVIKESRRSIYELRPWEHRTKTDLDYHLMQILYEHRCFNAYLHRFRIEKRTAALTMEI